MTNNIKRLSRGFTIIEVMIVLVIAGLILVIVFLAIPQLQRTQRDNARQSAVVRLKSEMETYASNNQGLYPFNTTGDVTPCPAVPAFATGVWADFYCRYINNQVNIKDPSSGSDIIGSLPGTAGNADASYVAPYVANITLPGKAGVTGVIYGAKCNGESVQQAGSASLSSKNYAMIIGLDRAGTRYCVDSG